MTGGMAAAREVWSAGVSHPRHAVALRGRGRPRSISIRVDWWFDFLELV
jgi:hypothetical protein